MCFCNVKTSHCIFLITMRNDATPLLEMIFFHLDK